MKPEMLASQFAALEEPKDAIVVDVALAPEVIVENVMRSLI
jgi:gluconokinase